MRLEWSLALATPQRIVLDTAFISCLRAGLKWQEVIDPTLSDLHPS